MSFSTRSLAAGAALLLVFGLGPSAAAPPRKGAERGVRLALIRLNGFLSRRDMAIVDEFVDADDTLLLGSAAGEKARGRAAIEAQMRTLFARPETISFAWREVEVSVRGTVAWLHADGEVVIHGEDGDRREAYRLTGVLELHGPQWKWRQFHGAHPPAEARAA